MVANDLSFVKPGEFCFEVFCVLVLELLVFLGNEIGLLSLCECFFLKLVAETSRRGLYFPLYASEASRVNSGHARAKNFFSG